MTASLYLYLFVALFVTTSIFGLLFLTQFSEKRETMRNYRIAKRLLAIAFFCVAIGNLAEILGYTGKPIDTSSQDFFLTQIVTLSIGVTQAFILTLVCVLLLDIRSVDSKKLKIQIFVIVLYVFAAVATYILLPISASKISILYLSAAYCVILVYFTNYFIRRYRAFRLAMDNFYSDDVADRMRWIAVAFYGALGTGVFALIFIQFPFFELSVAFNLFLLCFYTFFGIKLLNYPWQFEIIEAPMAEKINDEQIQEEQNSITKAISYGDVSHFNSDKTIENWVEEKHFLKSGITMDDLAKFLGTNRTYISSYFNTEKGISFRQWINFLRIDEAKHIIVDNPKITMVELASRLGYADTSTFFRQFKAKEGIQPSAWKQENLPN